MVIVVLYKVIDNGDNIVEKLIGELYKIVVDGLPQ